MPISLFDANLSTLSTRSSVDRASGFGPEGRGFKSCRVHKKIIMSTGKYRKLSRKTPKEIAIPKKTVGVIYGGPSAEHDVSLKTGANVIEALEKSNNFQIRPIIIDRQGNWYVKNIHSEISEALFGLDVVFIAMHGEYGEDGTIQGLLEAFNIPYTGSDMHASVIGMDKLTTKLHLLDQNIKTAKHKIYKKGQEINVPQFNFPVVVKPNAKGSSVGVYIAKNTEELTKTINEVLLLDNSVLVEEFITGREITIGVLEKFNGQDYFPLPITEIKPAEKYTFFDYEAKYTPGATEEITPADLPEKLKTIIENTAIEVFQAVGARHYSRIDMIIDLSHNVFVLEINTLPGLTNTSLLPQQAAAAGLPLEKLLEHLLQLAMSS